MGWAGDPMIPFGGDKFVTDKTQAGVTNPLGVPHEHSQSQVIILPFDTARGGDQETTDFISS